MKKKGLIISTIVMVVVLVASLSTATFAWFSSESRAAIEGVTINSRTAAGLQIASYYFDGSASHLYSGNVELNEKNVWTGATQTPGNELIFDASTGGLADGFFASSGDGLNMYTAGAMTDSIVEEAITTSTTLTANKTVMYGHYNSDNSNHKLGASADLTNADGIWIGSSTNATDVNIITLKNLGTSTTVAAAFDAIYISNEKVATENAPGSLNGDGSPKNLVKATENQAYFAVNLAVKLTAELAADNSNAALIIKSLELTGTKYMGATTRFALFQYNGGSGALENSTQNALATALTANNAICVIEPYATTTYSAGWGTDNAKADTKFIKTADLVTGQSALYAYPATSDSSKWETLANLYGAKYFKNTSDLSAAVPPAISLSDIKTGLNINANDNIECGKFTASQQVVYLKMVVWLEGEDSECVSSFANQTGLGVSIEFGTAAPKTV